jgi:acetyltransferase-like isoleucine patch superfamily enzyme
MDYIADDFQHGSNLRMGHSVIIEPDVIVKNNVKIGHRVTLKSGTVIDDNSIFDDHCITTGACYVGRNVNVRTGAIISRSTIIEDYCFIGPGVITNHTKHVTHGREKQLKNEQLLTYISYGSVIGSQASLLAGLYIGPQSIVGGGSVVIKDLDGYGVYVGLPCRKVSDLPAGYFMDEPENVGRMYMEDEILDRLKRYMPSLKLRRL